MMWSNHPKNGQQLGEVTPVPRRRRCSGLQNLPEMCSIMSNNESHCKKRLTDDFSKVEAIITITLVDSYPVFLSVPAWSTETSEVLR